MPSNDDIQDRSGEFVSGQWWALDLETYTPVPINSPSELEEWKQKDATQIAVTSISGEDHNATWVSTSFTTEKSSASPGQPGEYSPQLFETLGFIESKLIYQERYTSLDDSLKGHWAMITRILTLLSLSGVLTIEVKIGSPYQQRYRQLFDGK